MALPHIHSLKPEQHHNSIILDTISRRNLEIEYNLSGGTDNTLASVIDRTTTAMGSRCLRRWLHNPLSDTSVLKRRHQAIGELLETGYFEAIAENLLPIGDIERIMAERPEG